MVSTFPYENEVDKLRQWLIDTIKDKIGQGALHLLQHLPVKFQQRIERVQILTQNLSECTTAEARKNLIYEVLLEDADELDDGVLPEFVDQDGLSFLQELLSDPEKLSQFLEQKIKALSEMYHIATM